MDSLPGRLGKVRPVGQPEAQGRAGRDRFARRCSLSSLEMPKSVWSPIRSPEDPRCPDQIDVDPGLYAPILQGLGIVSGSKHNDAARRFADFLLGEEGRKLLGSYGFGTPADSESQ